MSNMNHYIYQIVTQELLDDPNCLNIRLGGGGGTAKGSMTPEGRARIRAARTGSSALEETRKKMSEKRLGVPMSAEHKKNTSAGLKGKPKSEKHRKHLSESYTEERKSISASNGSSPEARAKVAAAWTPERRARQSEIARKTLDKRYGRC